MATAVTCGPFSAWGCQEVPVLPSSSTTSPLRLGQPLSQGTPGWSSPPPPRTSPDAFASVSPQGREGQG